MLWFITIVKWQSNRFGRLHAMLNISPFIYVMFFCAFWTQLWEKEENNNFLTFQSSSSTSMTITNNNHNTKVNNIYNFSLLLSLGERKSLNLSFELRSFFWIWMFAKEEMERTWKASQKQGRKSTTTCFCEGKEKEREIC